MAHLKCHRCHEWKLRHSFYPKLGEGKRIKDKLCTACRKNILKTATNNAVLYGRVNAGLLDAQKLEEYLESRRQRRNEKGAQNLKKGKERKNMQTWERAHKSAYKAQAVLKAFKPLNDDEAVWVESARELISEALAQIVIKKRQIKLTEDNLHFWYDALEGGHSRLKRLISQFPRGASWAPLQVL